ncbi:MAG: SpoIID/LytB domain-containing protein [Phycisphaerae bacterium]|nr:SpoIID/LytB domain-containing protein [Phycisphaerae bacterium]
MSRHYALAPLLLAVALAGCDSPPPSRPLVSPKKPGEPLIRVRLQRLAGQIRLGGPARLLVQPRGRPDLKQLLPTPLSLRLVAGQWAGTALDPPLPPGCEVVVKPLGQLPLRIQQDPYPGHLRLVPRRVSSEPLSRFDVINHVRIEAYLPGVLERELYADWRPATYLAQAIAARTYAISRAMINGPGRAYDVESTTASQAYGGQSLRPLAVRAVAATMGMVLTWDQRPIAAFYSSTCGGIRLSPADAFGTPGAAEPLNPQAGAAWCAESEHHRWGPVVRDRAALSARIATWGRRRRLPVAALGRIHSVQVVSRNSLGRAVIYRLTDERGKSYDLRGESLRLAANFYSQAAKIPSPPRGQRLRSGWFKVDVVGQQVHFEQGRGFGHGVGLCQYGAQGMAIAGHDPLSILQEYYPQARIERAY